MKGLTYNLTTHQKHVRNYVFKTAAAKVMKQTNGVYPAPFKIIEVLPMSHDHQSCDRF